MQGLLKCIATHFQKTHNDQYNGYLSAIAHASHLQSFLCPVRHSPSNGVLVGVGVTGSSVICGHCSAAAPEGGSNRNCATGLLVFHQLFYVMNLKKDSPRIALCIWESSVLLTGISIYWFMGKPADMFRAVGSLVVISMLAIILIWYITTKQIDRMEKGKKLAGAVGILEGKMVLTMLVIIGIPAALLFYGSTVAGGPPYMFSLAGVYSGAGGAFSGGFMRKREIYEKGINLEVRFVEWKEIIGHEWKDGKLEIRFVGIPKKVTIRDRDGEIERLLENAHSEKVGLNAMDKQ